MPPQNTGVVAECAVEEDELDLIPEEDFHEIEERKFEWNIQGNIENLRNLDYSKVKWQNVILFIFLHVYAVYGAYLFVASCMWKTIFFAYLLYFLTAMGITMGVHRLWAHRSFKAILPLRIFLAGCQTISFQNSIYEWCRDHRVHHKFSETDADPHNAHRGFFFSHMGWLMYRKHPDVASKGKTLDLSDLMADPVVRFQKKYYLPLVLMACFVLPTYIPTLWGESWVTSLMVAGFLRYTVVLHITWMVNSLAHWLGSKPFDKSIYPSQNKLVASLAMGEGWHNYHHVFPFDYRTAEFGGSFHMNFTTVIIDFCHRMGWVYDLKVAAPSTGESRAKRTGDGTHVVKRKQNKVA